ncbi:MAG: TSUP family transporter [Gemmatimonadota bacterium]
MDPLALVVLATAVAGSFLVSATAGLGGSLILVPTLVIALGPKEGVALAALLLGGNNVFKVVAYRRAIPWRGVALVAISLGAGAWLGASLLVAAPAGAVAVAVLVALATSLLLERRSLVALRKASGPTLAFAAGATSGFSGTSGPLKGVALRNLGFDRFHLVGAASVVSLVGDATKAAVFVEASLLGPRALTAAILAFPLMPLATFAGRWLNARLGEVGYAALFWSVIAGYAVRLVV